MAWPCIHYIQIPDRLSGSQKVFVSSQYQIIFRWNTAVCPTDKQTFLDKKDEVARTCWTYGQTYEHGGGTLGPGPLSSVNPALPWMHSIEKLFCRAPQCNGGTLLYKNVLVEVLTTSVTICSFSANCEYSLVPVHLDQWFSTWSTWTTCGPKLTKCGNVQRASL